MWECRFVILTNYRNAGKKLWKMLKYGASRHPIEILETISNGPLDPKYYLKTLESGDK